MSTPITADELDDKHDSDDLYAVAQKLDIPGRSRMSKGELTEAVAEAVNDALADVGEIEEGDQVEMNHLSTVLEVTEVARENGTVEAVTMETSRGGRHRLQMETEWGVPRLQRWRGDDEEWMWNADYPREFLIVTEEADE